MTDDDFDFDPSDPLEDLQLEKLRQLELEETMRWSWLSIESAGIVGWLGGMKHVSPVKLTEILTEMLRYWESVEEYEKCAVLKRGINLISFAAKDQIVNKFPKKES